MSALGFHKVFWGALNFCSNLLKEHAFFPSPQPQGFPSPPRTEMLYSSKAAWVSDQVNARRHFLETKPRQWLELGEMVKLPGTFLKLSGYGLHSAGSGPEGEVLTSDTHYE